MRSEPARGVSLVELLIALALVAVLASVALPSYRGYVLRAGRNEARSALLSLATAQEKYYLQCHAYAAVLDPALPTACSPARLRHPTATERGHYTLAVAAADTNGWIASATRAAGSDQAADRSCRVFQLTSTGAATALDDAAAPSTHECWSR